MEQPTYNLLSALTEARENGYPHDFHLTEDGHFVSASGEEVSQPHIIEIVPCLRCGATLYLVASKDQQGTYVDHWEI